MTKSEIEIIRQALTIIKKHCYGTICGKCDLKCGDTCITEHCPTDWDIADIVAGIKLTKHMPYPCKDDRGGMEFKGFACPVCNKCVQSDAYGELIYPDECLCGATLDWTKANQ
jgi:hypothetical protein